MQAHSLFLRSSVSYHLERTRRLFRSSYTILGSEVTRHDYIGATAVTPAEREQKEPANDDNATIITIQNKFHYHTQKKSRANTLSKENPPSSNNPTPTPHPPPTPLRTPRLRIKLPPKKPIRLIPQHAPNKPRPSPLHLPRLLKNLL